ncbi:hypothetical protein MSAN_02083100 [Mycena sanguinolenta]|uniref:LACTB2 winged helix domain-containing protein n=1 Tax=Mycena sanguinolenta TaxID=230812 RepID=A0A8H7CM42_9AGAR|nr:hypothetical protein MSAN_02083100 [Mycena sanguinolenta]
MPQRRTTASICLHVPQDGALYSGHGPRARHRGVLRGPSGGRGPRGVHREPLRYARIRRGEGRAHAIPGYGPAIANGAQVIEKHIKHRSEREAQIVGILKTPPPGVGCGWVQKQPSVDDVDTATLMIAYPESLWLPAARGVMLHLEKLEGEGVVRRIGGEGKDTSWEFIAE